MARSGLSAAAFKASCRIAVLPVVVAVVATLGGATPAHAAEQAASVFAPSTVGHGSGGTEVSAPTSGAVPARPHFQVAAPPGLALQGQPDRGPIVKGFSVRWDVLKKLGVQKNTRRTYGNRIPDDIDNFWSGEARGGAAEEIVEVKYTKTGTLKLTGRSYAQASDFTEQAIRWDFREITYITNADKFDDSNLGNLEEWGVKFRALHWEPGDTYFQDLGSGDFYARVGGGFEPVEELETEEADVERLEKEGVPPDEAERMVYGPDGPGKARKVKARAWAAGKERRREGADRQPGFDGGPHRHDPVSVAFAAL